MMNGEKKMQVTIRFRNPSVELYRRVVDCVLTMKEATTVNYVVGGIYYDTEKTPHEVFQWFYDEGFVYEDFESVLFDFLS